MEIGWERRLAGFEGGGMAIRSYRDLDVWRKSMDLAVECYRLSQSMPPEERLGLALQLRRAAAAVSANIAEGRGRRRTKEFLRFLDIAYGSLAEMETYLALLVRLGYLKAEDTKPILADTVAVGRMLNGLIRTLRSRIAEPAES